MLGDLPVFLTFREIPLRQRFVDLRANHRLRQPGVQRKLSARRGFQQTEAVHKELKRLIRRLDVVLTLQVAAFHIPARVAGFGSTQNTPVREGHLAVRAAANAQIVAKAPVVQVVLTLIARLRIGRRFVLLIARRG